MTNCAQSRLSAFRLFLEVEEGDYLVLKTLAVTQFQVHLLFWDFGLILRLLGSFRFRFSLKIVSEDCVKSREAICNVVSLKEKYIILYINIV